MSTARCALLLSLIAARAAPQEPRFPDRPAQDALSYALDLTVDPAAARLEGTVAYRFRALEEPLTAIRLDARRSDAWSVRFTRDGAPWDGDWGEDHVVLTLPAPVLPGGEVTFQAALSGTPVDGFYFQDNAHGERMAFTDHYSIRARGWLPCEDHPADRARFSLRLRYPEGNEACAYGVEVPADAADAAADAAPEGWRLLHTASDVEIPPYMWAMVIGPLTRVPEAGDARLCDHLVYRQDVDRAKAMLVHHAAWIAAMERTFGPYPFGKYMTVQCPTRWGGFEAPGTVQLSEQLYAAGAAGVGTLAHELVHMWFGDGTGYAEWREVWLSEGFASYFGPWLMAESGGPTLAESMQRLRDAWLRSRDGRTKTVRDDSFVHPDQALNANTYPKGAWVLHMLRGELGDDAFFAALRAYATECRGRSVTTADFVAIVERSTGKDLGWFFAQWLDRVGCPELEVRATGGDITVRQVQPNAPYRFWLRLRWKDATGAPQQRRILVEDAQHTLQVDGDVRELQVDPDVELLFRER
ncbi:MAG: M1 family metallopeptidase [Planctomycetota bacterium]